MDPTLSQNQAPQTFAALDSKQELTANLIAGISSLVVAKIAALGALILTVGFYPIINLGALTAVCVIVGGAAAVGTFLLVRKIVRSCFGPINPASQPLPSSPQPPTPTSPSSVSLSSPHASFQTPPVPLTPPPSPSSSLSASPYSPRSTSPTPPPSPVSPSSVSPYSPRPTSPTPPPSPVSVSPSKNSPKASHASPEPILESNTLSVPTPISSTANIEVSLGVIQRNVIGLMGSLLESFEVRKRYYQGSNQILEPMLQDARSKNEISQEEADEFTSIFKNLMEGNSGTLDEYVSMLNTFNFELVYAFSSLITIIKDEGLSPYQKKAAINQAIQEMQPCLQKTTTELMPHVQVEVKEYTEDYSQLVLKHSDETKFKPQYIRFMIFILEQFKVNRDIDSNITIECINKLKYICEQISSLQSS